MANGDVYALDDGKNLFPTMTKEQILAAIIEAVNDGSISNIDAGFITKIKEINKNSELQFWTGTQAEYNALQNKDPEHIEYRITDDTTLSDIEQAISDIEADVSGILNGVTAVPNATYAKSAAQADYAVNANQAVTAQSASTAMTANNVSNLYVHFLKIDGTNSSSSYEYEIYITLTTNNSEQISKSSLVSMLVGRSVAVSGYVKDIIDNYCFPLSSVSGTSISAIQINFVKQSGLTHFVANSVYFDVTDTVTTI